MLLASHAQDLERSAVGQRYALDQASSKLGAEVYALSGLARKYALSGDPTHLRVYRLEAVALRSIETGSASCATWEQARERSMP